MDYFQGIGGGCPKADAIVEAASMDRGEWREVLRLHDPRNIRPSPAGVGPQSAAGLRWRERARIGGIDPSAKPP